MASDEKDTKPTLVNPKPEGQRHYENTSEYSEPHKSKTEPEEHVDLHAYGKDGEYDKEHSINHITDKDAVQMGKDSKELRKNKE